MKAKKYFLISIRMLDANAELHGYLVTNQQADAGPVANDMIVTAEEMGMNPLPLILITDLSGKDCMEERDFLQTFLKENSPEAKRLMKEATDFYYSAFLLPQDDPASVRIMKMH
jgi:hypothetical protein